MKPAISIIIPAFNEEKVIERTIKQFLPFKKKFDLEIIVSDGGSKDNTINLARKLADKVYIHKFKRRQTIAEGRNKGAELASADILMFIDADVRIPNKLKFFSTVLNAFKNKWTVAGTAIVRVYPEEETFKDKFFSQLIKIVCCIFIWAGIGNSRGELQIIRKNTFNQMGGYNESLVASEDFDLFNRVIKIGNVLFFKNLIVYESPRRYRKTGYIRLYSEWILNGLNVLFRKRSFSTEWVPVR